MNKSTVRFINTLAVIVVFGAQLAIPAIANPMRSPTQASARLPIKFKTPNGYMAVDFPGHTGKLLLDPKKPGGMFVAYPKDGQTVDAFIDEVKKMVADMFLHDAKEPVVWNVKPLQSPKEMTGQSGNLLTTADEKFELQIAYYVRNEGVTYGYFAMRHKKSKGEDAKFVDGTGAGVKAFDELAKSISATKN